LVPLKTNPLQLESSRSNDKEEGNLFSICSHISTHASGDIDHMKCHWSIIFIQLKQKKPLEAKRVFYIFKSSLEICYTQEISFDPNFLIARATNPGI
jgi:hypothetical protein